ncbi:DUF2599 domain-containing protein [Listeria welshimeri]|uniref:DUF2599 domain-containing protein n=1 Tax=Listeria welshimeri TaxID=1643 RepID=UPI0016272102|nr:DUF2599 domain-containing protein [Listeria welshimeri]MBC1445517.1 DUF2599 domain-containing protein [Listeria welshimeri]MBC2008859.1 DUF2599 domain-containing protein [Listeria welshimeri]MBF2508539.1 DUF2599 domain-containing protein [Listeria welshimeri]MBF2560183.1 DUF2599 domain-containing protein [Listeria welshimeri]MBF2565910.1 DUF2599 domain-containing protein [Listeria welshimeri]
MKKNKVFFSGFLVIIMVISTVSLFVQPIVAYAIDTEEEIGDIDIEDVDIENMDELEIDLIDGVENADSVETEEKIVSSQEDLEVSISKDEAKVNIEQTEEEFSVSIDDTLEYIENEDGTLIYQNKDRGYSVDAQALDGGARFLFNIESDSSAKRFKIDFTIEDGGYLTKDENGDFYIADANGEVIVLVGRAWAVDNEGNFIETFYEQEGNSIYQVVEYSGDKYPLTADPLFCSDTIDNTSTTYSDSKMSGKFKGVFNVYARTCAKLYISSYWISMAFTKKINLFPNALIARDMWYEVTADASFVNSLILKRNGARVRDQFLCHALNPSTIWKASWNLEPRRPDVSLTSTYKQLCNPK